MSKRETQRYKQGNQGMGVASSRPDSHTHCAPPWNVASQELRAALAEAQKGQQGQPVEDGKRGGSDVEKDDLLRRLYERMAGLTEEKEALVERLAAAEVCVRVCVNAAS